MKRNLSGIPKIFLYFILIAVIHGCSKVSVPVLNNRVGNQVLSSMDVETIIKSPPEAATSLVAKSSPLPQSALSMLKAGDTNTYGVKVTPGLEKAYEAYLSGNGEDALSVLKTEIDMVSEADLKWQLSFLKGQVLLMMGRGAEAEQELETTANLEAAFIGHDLNTTALRAEVKTWLGDFNGARHDLALVIKSVGNWELPISYSSFPTNRTQLYMFTTAKLRAYTALTAIHIFEENYRAAQVWGQEAERLFNNAHFVINHPLYGAGDKPHPDSYYGRALNLTFLASAVLAVEKKLDKAEEIFAWADSFYDTLGYSAGKVTTAALKARIFNRLGMHDRCYRASREAMKLAVEANLPDYIWRIGILSGKTLLAKGRKKAAEEAFRQAQASVDLISGGLSTDRAKTRFGVGKEDITYYLVQLDMEKQDWQTLFLDLEKGRARAFVDMLRDRPSIRNRQSGIMSEIDRLEKELRQLRLKNLAFNSLVKEKTNTEKALLKKHKTLVRQLRKRDPELADLVSVSAIPLKQVQKKLHRGDVLIYFLPAKEDDQLKYLRITNSSVELEKLNVTLDQLEEQVEDFSLAFFDPEELENRGVILKKTFDSATEPLSSEYAVNALKKSLNPKYWGVKRNAYVVPTGILHFMPWAILDTTFPISVLPTGGWVTRNTGKTFSQNGIAIVGDPEFGGMLPQLRGARLEAELVGKLHGAHPLLGKAATEKNLRKNVGKGVKILHFATHGVYNAIQPLQSALFLSKDSMASALTASTLFENPVPANLVVLSACETGLGKTIAGDDLLGLARSFYLGGAQSILSSLWEIEDQGTKEFMLKFHQESVKGDYGKAWIKARDHVKLKGYPAYVYGAFNLGGNI